MKRFHRKTRTGCAQCRKRRVKCDESVPSCSGCKRNNLPCSFHFFAPGRVTSHALDPKNSYHGQSVRQPPGFLAKLDVSLSSSILNNKNMELLRHYISVTCLDLGSRPMNVFTIEVPRLALSHDFVMYGIYAIASLHLADLQPHRRPELLARAAAAERAALPSYQAHVAKGSTETIHAVLAFAAVLPPYLMAQSTFTPGDQGRIPSHDDDQPHWFFLFRGLAHLLFENWEDLSKGPLGAILQTRSHPTVDNSCNPEDKHLAKIYSLLSSPDVDDSVTEEEMEGCRVALDQMRWMAALPLSPDRPLDSRAVPSFWPGSVPDGYMRALTKRKPEALIILAHYCVFVKRLDWVWYFKGVGTGLLASIEHELGPAWRPWITWALERPTVSEQPPEFPKGRRFGTIDLR